MGLGRGRMIGCVAITEPVFFAPDEWVAVPSDWSRNIVSGRTEDLSRGDGLRMWTECLEQAAATGDVALEWPRDALDAQRAGKPVLIMPRLGQSSFRLAVLDAYGQQCAVTTEHSLPVIDARTSDRGRWAEHIRSRTTFRSDVTSTGSSISGT